LERTRLFTRSVQCQETGDDGDVIDNVRDSDDSINIPSTEQRGDDVVCIRRYYHRNHHPFISTMVFGHPDDGCVVVVVLMAVFVSWNWNRTLGTI
jgi:hypothetical protein